MKSTLIMLIAFIATTTLACAQITNNWETAKKQGEAAVDSGDCAQAWNLIWPWARSGQVEARAILAGGVFAAGLTPPGGSGDAISQFRHAVILAVHGAAEGDPAATELLHSLIRTELVSDMGGRKMKLCLEAGLAPHICVAEAVKLGFVPDFDAYAKEIDAVATLPGAAAAFCKLGNKKEAGGL